jgi:ABC-type glycerol-3-phosphate transport system substrate-binding protein
MIFPQCSQKKAFIYVLIAVLMALQTSSFVSAETSHRLADRYPVYQSSDNSNAQTPYYLDYISQLSAQGKTKSAKKQIDLSVSNTVSSDGKSHANSRDGVQLFDWSLDTLEWVQWTFQVPENGFYNIEIDYLALDGTVDSPRRSIEIDGGEINFKELSNVVFPRYWFDDGKPWTNVLGDQIRPKQSEKSIRQVIKVEDALGRYDEPLKFYFEAGSHTLKFNYIQEPLELYRISMTPVEQVQSYKEVLTKWKSKGYKEATGQIKINGENPVQKTDSSLGLQYSSDPLADPPTTGSYILNAIGGNYWNKGGQGITWNFDVLQSGLYKIDMRAYQKYNDGLSSYRQIQIDGKVPYKEFLSYEFPYSGWSTNSVKAKNGDPYLVYLEKGTHTLGMFVKTSHYMDVLFHLEQTLGTLSKVIQNTIMVTGITPDTNFDYQLQKKIPWIMNALKDISTGLGKQVESLDKDTSKTPGPVNSLLAIKYRVDKMIKDPFVIASNLTYMIDDQTTLSSWIKEFNNSPLMLDYILISSPNLTVQNKTANVFQYTWFALRNFIQSFYRDYDTVASIVKGKANVKTIKVWVSRGKEWGEILKQISDEDFTKKTNINVDMNILPSGQLGTSGVMLLAVASGTAPDFVIGSDSTVPVEYGMRDVVADLSKLDGYADISKRFLDGVMIPYQFKGNVFALPETMDFSVLYYRKDIMSSLNLTRPNTWDDIYTKILPVLKRNGMDFWYEGGLNTFLFQNNASFYSQDGLRSGLDTNEANNAFKQFCDLYKIYDVPVAANFYTRFRAGQIPIGISSFNTYLLLTSAAPELLGKWSVSIIPGTMGKDGVINRGNSVNSTSIMIFKSSKKIQESWEFLKWYTSKDVQVRYADDLVAYIGPEAKWCSANVEAFDSLSWDNNLKKVIVEQRNWCKGVPNVVGGYITARQVENARVRSVIEGQNYRESLEKTAKDINRELELKNAEFKLRAEQQGKG